MYNVMYNMLYNVMYYCIREELRKRKLVRMNSIVDLPYPEALRWQIRDETKSSILSATVHMDE